MGCLRTLQCRDLGCACTPASTLGITQAHSCHSPANGPADGPKQMHPLGMYKVAELCTCISYVHACFAKCFSSQ